MWQTAIQLSNNERVSKGDNIEYVYTDSQHQNPLSRVVPAQFIRNNDTWSTTRKSILKCCWTLLKLFWEFLADPRVHQTMVEEVQVLP